MNLLADLAVAAVRALGPAMHHTVPVYMCGHADQKKVGLVQFEHQELHRQLSLGVAIADVSMRTVDRVLRFTDKRTSGIHFLAKSRLGRAAIGTGLQNVYRGPWWFEGTPTIGSVFPEEKDPFVDGKTSCPKVD
jgi:hypothetical protein